MAVPCFDAASHSALRNSHVHSPCPTTVFAFCSEAIQSASSLIAYLPHHLALSNAQVPSGPGSPPSRCHGTSALRTVLFYCSTSSHSHGTHTCPLTPSV